MVWRRISEINRIDGTVVLETKFEVQSRRRYPWLEGEFRGPFGHDNAGDNESNFAVRLAKTMPEILSHLSCLFTHDVAGYDELNFAIHLAMTLPEMMS